jgi:hypothetical protein
MLVGSFVVIVAFLFGSKAGKSLKPNHRLAALFVCGVGLVVLERYEAANAEAPKGMPRPPLLILMPPGKLGYLHPLTKVPNLPLALNYVPRPMGGFAGFGKLGANAADDAMLGIGGVTFKNLSDRPLALMWSLSVRGEGLALELKSDGRGRWERQLNVNDWFGQRGSKLRWTLAPLLLPPNDESRLKDLGFVAPNLESDDWSAMAANQMNSSYSFELEFTDLNTGVTSSIPLPFGQPPYPNPDLEVTRLRRMVGEQ